jgi:tetratricopeptide (TPR) repeat protein
MHIPATLRERLLARRVVPFVGAGVSMAVRHVSTGRPLFSGWKELLRHAAELLKEEGKEKEAHLVHALLETDPADFLYAARRARDGLGPVWFNLLKKEFDHPRDHADESTLALARTVWKLGSDLVITTNYDRVLEWTSPSDPAIWNIQAPVEQVRLLQGKLDRRTVWHLHGIVDDVANIILTPDGYDLLYPADTPAQARYVAALDVLRAQITSHTFLFIGFSLDDERFVSELRRNLEVFSGAAGPHYALVAEASLERLRTLGLAVEPLTFAGYGAPLVHAVEQLGAVIAEESRRSFPLAQTETLKATPTVPKRVFFVPFRPKGDQVIGRDAALLAVREQLVSGQRTAIGQTAAFQGLGGLGKTQLAVEYAYRYAAEYANGVIWLNADQDLPLQLVELAERNLWVVPEADTSHKHDIAKDRIRNLSDLLLIFDNLEDFETVKPYLPAPQASPHILVTSRMDQPGFSPVPLDPLAQDLSLALLLQEAGRVPTNDDDWAHAQSIVGALGGLPLAVELAGAFLRHRAVSWSEYHELLKQNLRKALPGRLLKGSFTRHEADLYSTLKIGEAVFNDEPKLKEVLDLLTWSGSAPMGRGLLASALDATDIADLTNALSLGVSLRLLQRSPDTERYAIHRLVREVRREEISLADHRTWATSTSRRVAGWFRSKRFEFIAASDFEAEVDHLNAWYANALEITPHTAAELAWLRAYPHFHLGQFGAAAQWVKTALDHLKDVAQNDSELNGEILSDFATLHTQLGDAKRSIEIATESLELWVSTVGETHAGTARALNALGSAYSYLGKYEAALSFQIRALDIRRSLHGENHFETATSYHNVGANLNLLGRRELALQHLTKSLEIHERLVGSIHPGTAFTRATVGQTYLLQNKLKLAYSYLRTAVDILEMLFGETHPHLGEVLDHLANVQWASGQRSDAIVTSRRALSILLDRRGERHQATIITAYNLAAFLFRNNDQEEALKIVDRFILAFGDDPNRRAFQHLRSLIVEKTIRPGFRASIPDGSPKKKTRHKKKW